MYRPVFASVFVGLSLIALGLLATRAEPAPPGERTIRVIPSNLFRGELKRLEPHLGLKSGCVKLVSEGPTTPTWVHFEFEFWSHGKAEKSRVSGFPFSPGEVSVSARPESDDKGHNGLRLVLAQSSSSSGHSVAESMWIPLPKLSRGSSLIRSL